VNWLFRDCRGYITAHYLDGVPIEVSGHDYHGRNLYLFGTNDPKVSAVCSALLCAGDVFLDIGANHGSIGIQAARMVGLEGAVHLFEPQKELCERVESALVAGAYRNAQLHRIGLWNTDGPYSITIPTGHSGIATFEDRVEMVGWPTREVCEVRDVSTYLPPLIRDRSFAAKVDIEGGAKIIPWLLSQPRLRFLVFEVAHNQYELYGCVKAVGLTLFGLLRHPFLLRMIRIDDFEEMSQFHDVVAVRIPLDMANFKRISPTALVRHLNAAAT
jgi:FkbM family methyltransferase